MVNISKALGTKDILELPLNEEQCDNLKILKDKVKQDIPNAGMILAQLYPSGKRALCIYVDSETAKKITKIINKYREYKGD